MPFPFSTFKALMYKLNFIKPIDISSIDTTEMTVPMIVKLLKNTNTVPDERIIEKLVNDLPDIELNKYISLANNDIKGVIYHKIGLYYANKREFQKASISFSNALKENNCPSYSYWHAIKNIIASGNLELLSNISDHKEAQELALERNKTASFFAAVLSGDISIKKSASHLPKALSYSEGWSSKALISSFEEMIKNIQNVPKDYLLPAIYLYALACKRTILPKDFGDAIMHFNNMEIDVKSNCISNIRYLIELLNSKESHHHANLLIQGVVNHLDRQDLRKLSPIITSGFRNDLSSIIQYSFVSDTRKYTQKLINIYSDLTRQSNIKSVREIFSNVDPLNKSEYDTSFAKNFLNMLSITNTSKNLIRKEVNSVLSTPLSAPKVSLVIPAYNSEEFISMTLKSVKNQTLKDFECIIVNDASTDDTASIIKNEILGDIRFKVITHRVNSGLSASRNSGMRAARGEFVCFLDSDDLLMIDSLKKRSDTLMNITNPNIIGTYCGSLSIKESAVSPPTSSYNKNLKEIDFLTSSAMCPFNANQPMFVTKKIRKEGGFNESLTQAEDYEFWTRLLRKGYYFLPTNENLVTYRQRSGSMIRREPLLHLRTSLKWYDSQYKEFKYLDPNVLFSKPWPYYKSQLDSSNRVLEFSGIALAKGDKVETIASILVDRLPDFENFISRHRDFRSRVQVGYERYVGSKIKDLPKWESNNCKSALLKLEIAFHNELTSVKRKRANSAGDTRNNASTEEFSLEEFLSSEPSRTYHQVAFIPHKTYHVDTIQLFRKELLKRKINFTVIDISQHYRDEGVRDACEKYNLPIIGYSNWVLNSTSPKLLVSFNDWDPIVRSIFVKAQKFGIKTASIVEGIQDYFDVDTKQLREAYKSSDIVYLPGNHDKKYFKDSDQELIELGVPRILKLRQRKYLPHKRKQKIILINSNFSYGVLEDIRDSWLQKAVMAVTRSGHIPIVTKHPADKGTTFSNLVTNDDFYKAVEKSDLVISRFASAILESIAMNKPVIYLKPKNELCDKFDRPNKAFKVINNEKSLQNILSNIDDYTEKTKKSWFAYLESHSGKIKTKFETNFVDHVESVLVNIKTDKHRDYEFKNCLIAMDQKTLSFSKINELRSINIAKYGNYKNELKKRFGLNVFDLSELDIMDQKNNIIIRDVQQHRINIDVKSMYKK